MQVALCGLVTPPRAPPPPASPSLAECGSPDRAQARSRSTAPSGRARRSPPQPSRSPSPQRQTPAERSQASTTNCGWSKSSRPCATIRCGASQDFSQPDSLTNRCGQGEHTRHEVQALVNGGEAKAGTPWKDWPEIEQDERIGVGLADKPKSADGRADGSGRAPKVYHYKPKVKPQRAETLARLVEQVVKALRDNPVRRIAQAFPPDS